MLAFVAGPSLDTGQIITHLLISFLPIIIIALLHAAIPSDPMSRRFLVATFQRQMHWRLRGLMGPIHRPVRKKERKKFCKPVQTRWNAADVPMTRRLLRTYLLPVAIVSYRVSCRVECFLRALRCPQASSSYVKRATALATTGNQGPKPINFDSDSFPIGVDCHASYCMVNSKHLLEDLTLTPHDKRRVDGINEGLAIAGEGTFRFTITDDNGKRHTIRIPNSLYLPGLKSCLLSPQHWAQEAGDNQTFMGSFAHCCTLHWGDGFVKTIPFNPATNTPILHTASTSRTYRVYAAIYEACEAAFYRPSPWAISPEGGS